MESTNELRASGRSSVTVATWSSTSNVIASRVIAPVLLVLGARPLKVYSLWVAHARRGHSVEIKGKKAVVVGGASGMARASAEMLHERGAAVAILDLPTSAGQEVASSLGGSFHPLDITDDDGTEQAIADAVTALGGLHIAVNTAGGGTAMRTLTKNGPHPLADFRRVVELNLIGTFNLNRLQAFHMSTN